MTSTIENEMYGGVLLFGERSIVVLCRHCVDITSFRLGLGRHIVENSHVGTSIRTPIKNTIMMVLNHIQQ